MKFLLLLNFLNTSSNTVIRLRFAAQEAVPKSAKGYAKLLIRAKRAYLRTGGKQKTMEKLEIGAKTFLCSMPATLVGANIRGKPNYLTITTGKLGNTSPERGILERDSRRRRDRGVSSDHKWF